MLVALRAEIVALGADSVALGAEFVALGAENHELRGPGDGFQMAQDESKMAPRWLQVSMDLFKLIPHGAAPKT